MHKSSEYQITITHKQSLVSRSHSGVRLVCTPVN